MPATLPARLLALGADGEHPVPPLSASGPVTITSTTCKRPDLFLRSVRSFLRCEKDLSLIRRWITVDDGTPDADWKRQGDAFRWMEHAAKTDPSEKGHGRSMNWLRDHVNVHPPFWCHLEDDWQWFMPGQHLLGAISVMLHDRTIAQVVFNRCYAEHLSDPGVYAPKEVLTTPGGVRYIVHEYDPSKRDAGRSHWPGFSLNPSLMRTEAIKDLGPFAEGPAFEHEFALRLHATGMRVAYLDDVRLVHIGRLTTERGESNPNAYMLNGEQQW